MNPSRRVVRSWTRPVVAYGKGWVLRTCVLECGHERTEAQAPRKRAPTMLTCRQCGPEQNPALTDRRHGDT